MNRKKMILLTSLLVFIPTIIGLILWNKLPEELPVHFNAAGEIDNWESKTFVVFFMPLFLWGTHLLTGFIILADPKKQNIGDKMFLLTLLIIPFTSVFICILTYCPVLGIEVSAGLLGNLFLGIVFIVIGNYLPKSRQNYTVGIKIPWTLSDAENWNKTHRLAGIVWLLCGILLVANAFLKFFWIIPVAAGVTVLLPTAYSFLLYLQKGKNTASDQNNHAE